MCEAYSKDITSEMCAQYGSDAVFEEEQCGYLHDVYMLWMASNDVSCNDYVSDTNLNIAEVFSIQGCCTPYEEEESSMGKSLPCCPEITK